MALTLSLELSKLDFQLGITASPVAPVLAYGGTTPYSFTVSPSLPSGLTLDSATGVISGTPVAVQSTTTYAIEVTDGVNTDSKLVDIWVYSSYPVTTVTPSTTSTNEGGTVTFTVNVVGIADGTTLYWNTTGSVFANDFADNVLVGSFVVSSGSGTITRTLRNDLDTDGNDFFRIEVLTGGTSGLLIASSPIVYVNDTSITGAIKHGTLRSSTTGGLLYHYAGSWYKSTGTVILIS